jgi:hypothetical protein
MTNRLGVWQKLLLVFIVGLPVAAWSGLLDFYSEQYVDEALLHASIIFGTARGINAIVSALQGTEIDALLLTLSIGEVLDPINDLIERFSTVMLFALGALAMQKILLGMVSHDMFNFALTLLALGVVLLHWRGNQKLLRALTQMFVVALFLRFSLALVVLTNSWVDATFLKANEQQHHTAMEDFQGELREISGQAGIDTTADQRLDASEAALATMLETRMQQLAELDFLRKGIAETGNTLRQHGMLRWTIPWVEVPADVAVARQELKQLKQREDLEEDAISEHDAAIAKQRKEIACLRKRLDGEACSIFESLADKIAVRDIVAKIYGMDDSIAAFSNDAINLLMSILLKSVVIPLLFLYLVLKFLQLNWRRL